MHAVTAPQKQPVPSPVWPEFNVSQQELPKQAPASIHTPAGIADRILAAAFAEIQARDAFLWAAETHTDAPATLREIWRRFAVSEQKHLDLLLQRLSELKIDAKQKAVYPSLWATLTACPSARNFAWAIAEAEERGRKAAIRFAEQLSQKDLKTALIFKLIAAEETEHVETAYRYFPKDEPASIKSF